MGASSALAAAEAVGYESIGIELDEIYFEQAEASISRLAALYSRFIGDEMTMQNFSSTAPIPNGEQLSMLLAEGSAPYRASGKGKGGREVSEFLA